LDGTLDNADGANWGIQSVLYTPGAENYFSGLGEHNYSGIVINEIHYNPFDSVDVVSGDTINGRKFEFVELKNIASVPIDLSGTFFARGIDYEFEDGITIQPGDFIVLAEDKSSFLDRYGFAAFDKYDGQLDNGGETLWLVNRSGVLLDAVTYDDAFPWDTEADGGLIDYSLALIEGNSNNSTRLNWKVQCQITFTPGAENDFGCFQGYDYNGLIINEIHYDPSSGNNAEFVEFVNRSFNLIDLEEVVVKNGISHVFDQFFLPPGQYLVLANDSATFHNTYGFAPHAEFIGNLANGGETIRLEDLFGDLIDVVKYDDVSPWPSQAGQGAHSAALTNWTLNNNHGSSWCIQDVNFTPKLPNTFEDTDGDGIFDCQDSCPNLDNALIGQPCDDGILCTSGETYDSNCDCSGGVFQDSDNDGVCDPLDQCSGLDDSLIGQPCSDGDPCTIGEMYNNNCQCTGGTNSDSDSDGICDGLDQCPNFDDALIGQVCNDGDVCTTGETFTSNCVCEGGTFEDEDGDGVCDANDQCPGGDDNLIGQSCDDGDQCTINDMYNSSCNCAGTQTGDADVDGVCDAIDQCPNFNDNLIGQPCDDGIICFTGSTWDTNCNCTGGAYSDTDGDSVCDPLDVCPGFDDDIDVNNNGIPDGCEGCVDFITENSQSQIINSRNANVSIVTNGWIPNNGNIEYAAGQSVELVALFEVKAGAVFHAYISPCN